MAIVNFYGALMAFVLADSSISDIVGDRMFLGRAPQKVDDPYIVFHLIDSVDIAHLNGQTGIVVERWQLDCYSQSATTVISLNDAVYERLKFVAYVMMSNYKVLFAHRVNFSNFEEPTGEGEQTIFYRHVQDFSIKRNFQQT